MTTRATPREPRGGFPPPPEGGGIQPADSMNGSVAIIEDKPEWVAALSARLVREGWQVAWAGDDPRALLRAGVAFDVALLDVDLHGRTPDDATVTGLLRAARKGTIVVSEMPDKHYGYMARLAKLGVDSWVPKQGLQTDEIMRAVTDAYHERSYASPRLMQVVAKDRTHVPANVTSVERDCLDLVSEGFNNAEVGALLGISERAARRHLNQLRNKLAAAGYQGVTRAMMRMRGLALLSPRPVTGDAPPPR